MTADEFRKRLRTLSRGERIFVRVVAIVTALALLLAPVSLLVTLWTGDWRWFLTGLGVAVIGLLAFLAVREGVRS